MNNSKDLTGQKFGRWTVLGLECDCNRSQNAKWKCQCECGTIKAVYAGNLKYGKSKSCGCLQKEINASNKTKDLLNQKFGKLLVIEKTERRYSSNIIWKCLCECGNFTEVCGYDLQRGHTTSCGCVKYSIGEQKIIDILKTNNIPFIKEKTFSDFIFEDTNYSPRYDFFLPSFNRLIEFDGIQHFSNTSSLWSDNGKFERRKKSDLLKNQYALNHNIPLVRIPYTERDNITLDLLLGDKYLITS